MNPLAWSFRQYCLFGLLACLGLLGFALYAQHKMFLDPCPLCILQRIAFMIMALGFLVGAAFPQTTKTHWLSVAIAVVGASAGVTVAGRHLWLQNLPADQVPACGPGLGYMLEAFPLKDVLMKVFAGSGECAKIDWHFLGVSMPGWTLIWYVALLVGLLVIWRRGAVR